MWKNYLLGHENKQLRSMRESGDLSFYRVKPCKVCGEDTLKDVPYCSKRCYNIAKEMKMENAKNWDEIIARYIGKSVEIETLDGMYLAGILTKVETKEVEIDKILVTLPVALVLDNDAEKVVDMARFGRLIGK